MGTGFILPKFLSAALKVFRLKANFNKSGMSSIRMSSSDGRLLAKVFGCEYYYDWPIM